jgi:hypothetical protein
MRLFPLSHLLYKQAGHEARFSVILEFLCGGAIGLVDGLVDYTPQKGVLSPLYGYFLEGFLWAFIIVFFHILIGIELYYYQRPKHEKVIFGHFPLICPIGAYFGFLQAVFFFVYGIMRGMLDWLNPYTNLWIIPGITIPLYLFYIWVGFSLVIGVIGAWLVYEYGAEVSQ